MRGIFQIFDINRIHAIMIYIIMMINTLYQIFHDINWILQEVVDIPLKNSKLVPPLKSGTLTVTFLFPYVVYQYAAAAHSIPFDIWFIIYVEIYLAISIDESISSLEYLLQQTAVFHCMEYLLWNPWKHSTFWFPLVEARCINIKSLQMSATFNSLR